MTGVTDDPILSVVIPVYDEEESVRSLYQRLCNACDTLQIPYEAAAIDGGRPLTATATGRRPLQRKS
jgi:hypothetical protein